MPSSSKDFLSYMFSDQYVGHISATSHAFEMLIYVSLLDLINSVIFFWSMPTIVFLAMWFSPTSASGTQGSILCNPLLPRMQPRHLIWRHASLHWGLGFWILCGHMWNPTILAIFHIWKCVECNHMICQLAFLVRVFPLKIQKLAFCHMLGWFVHSAPGMDCLSFLESGDLHKTQNQFLNWLYPWHRVCCPEWQHYY